VTRPESPVAAESNSATGRLIRLESEVADLRKDVADLREQFASFRKQFE
jgi:hypothetical protein